jgi:hypothetical protein
MSFSIQGSRCFSQQISDRRIEKIKQAKTLEEALYMGYWDKLTSHFFGTDKTLVLSYLYEILNHGADEAQNTQQNPISIYKARHIIAYFKKLCEKVIINDRELFSAKIVPQQNHAEGYILDIQLAGINKKFIYGNEEDTLQELLSGPIKNTSRVLLGPIHDHKNILTSLKNAHYQSADNTSYVITGVSSDCKTKSHILEIEKLTATVRKKLLRSPIFQEWLEIRIRLHDHFHNSLIKTEQQLLQDIEKTDRSHRPFMHSAKKDYQSQAELDIASCISSIDYINQFNQSLAALKTRLNIRLITTFNHKYGEDS